MFFKALILFRNVNADAERSNGLTPLFSAAEKGTAEVTMALLNRGKCVVEFFIEKEELREREK